MAGRAVHPLHAGTTARSTQRANRLSRPRFGRGAFHPTELYAYPARWQMRCACNGPDTAHTELTVSRVRSIGSTSWQVTWAVRPPYPYFDHAPDDDKPNGRGISTPQVARERFIRVVVQKRSPWTLPSALMTRKASAYRRGIIGDERHRSRICLRHLPHLTSSIATIEAPSTCERERCVGGQAPARPTQSPNQWPPACLQYVQW